VVVAALQIRSFRATATGNKRIAEAPKKADIEQWRQLNLPSPHRHSPFVGTNVPQNSLFF
jgi:hypothetical protein